MRTRVAALCAMILLLVACGLSDDREVHRVGAGNIPFSLSNTLPTTSTSTTTTVVELTTTSDAATSTTIDTEAVVLYYITGARLNSVSIPLTSRPALQQVIEALQEGPPPGVVGTGLRSALPRTVEISVTDDGTGVAAVDLPIGFFDTITTTDQRLAIAQIVLTLTERPRIGQVSFTQGGEPIRVPRGTGDLAEPGEPLAIRDYQSLLTNAPVVTPTTPPATSTSTSSTAPAG